MDLNEINWKGVTIKTVMEKQAAALKLWRSILLAGPDPDSDEEPGKVGLWIYGPRVAGTTYTAKTIVSRMAFEDGWRERIFHVEATDLIRSLQRSWDGSAQVRAHADDMGLWQEKQADELALEFYFYEAEVLWIDDLHHDTVNWNLWRKHFQPMVERRVKHGMPTIVCTTLPPDNSWLPAGLIEEWFIPVAVAQRADRFLVAQAEYLAAHQHEDD